MSSALVGVICLLVFALSQAVRDVFFGNVFQSVSFLSVAILAFGGASVLFGAWSWFHDRRDVVALLGHGKLLVALNATTAAAWIMYFFALKNLEPATVTTLYTGVGPSTVLALAVCGLAIAKRTQPGRLELLGHLGVLGSLVAIAGVAVLGNSGLSDTPTAVRVVAVVLAIAGGALITISHMIARHLGDLGIGSATLMGLRFPLALAVVVLAEWTLGRPDLRPELHDIPFVALAALALIVIPSFFLQLGVARNSPLTVNVMRALGPIFVFAAQQFDNRLSFSGATLTCILSFVIFASLTSALRGWSETRQAFAKPL